MFGEVALDEGIVGDVIAVELRDRRQLCCNVDEECAGASGELSNLRPRRQISVDPGV